MALDCITNATGPAHNTFHGSFITNCIFIAFLTLCIILLQGQLVIICDKLYFSKYFNVTFKKIYCVLQTVIGLYWVARQCRQFYVPECRLKRIKQGLSQQLIQTSPPTDKSILVFQTRLTLIFMEPSPSPLLAPPTPQTLALQQDRVTEEFETETVSEPVTPIEETPI